ncbi:MAG: hypothetical protein BroJett040_00960 [Oligoflexia bacterium]|nr:MAG: hypothetical protein BroJett040_00960 [Oligoflexia bacterium]
MRTEVHFTHMDRSEALESLALEKFEGIVEEFLHRDESHVQIWLVNEKSHGQKGEHQFKCEVSVRYPPKKEIFVNKTATDMHDAINMTASTLMQLLRDESKKEIKKKHGH